jgi:DNA repair photolyase
MQHRGRGATTNPNHRFSLVQVERDPEYFDPDEADVEPRTKFWDDNTQQILSQNDSPDVGFDRGLNAYRGCEHGCAYCFARPSHEYLGYSPGLDFETNIHVKRQAPELLRKELMKKSWKPQVVMISGITDAYQPVERRLKLTRGCLEVMLEFRNPVAMITKNHLITRDIDIISQLAELQLVQVSISVTTLDEELSRKMEPRASIPARRLKAVEKLSAAGIPVHVMVGPTIPGLTDHEIPEIVRHAKEAGAKSAGYIPLRLPWQVKEVFTQWLEDNYPLRKEKVLGRIRELRGGKLNDPNFHSRFHGVGKTADNLERLYEVAMKRAGLENERVPLRTDLFRRPEPAQRQLELF